MAIENNGMVYTFTEKEIEAVGRLVRWAKEYKKLEATETIKIVGTAFNRPFFNKQFYDEKIRS